MKQQNELLTENISSKEKWHEFERKMSGQRRGPNIFYQSTVHLDSKRHLNGCGEHLFIYKNIFI